MEIAVADERAYWIKETLTLEQAQGRAWAKKADAFGTIAKFLQRPKREEIISVRTPNAQKGLSADRPLLLHGFLQFISAILIYPDPLLHASYPRRAYPNWPLCGPTR